MPGVLTSPSTRIIDQEHVLVGAWLRQHGAGYFRDGSTCIGLERDGELVAATMYDFCNGASIYANIAITGRITREWLWFIFYYPFVQLGVNVMLANIASDNAKSIHLVERFGFKLLVPIHDADPSGATLLYALYRHQCRFLRSPYV